MAVPADLAPRVHVVPVRVLVDEGTSWKAAWRERSLSGLRLWCPPELEDEARLTIESFGPLELVPENGVTGIVGEPADYVVDLEGNLDALVSFASLAVPRLRAMGWEVEIDESLPCKVVEASEWYSELAASTDAGWFELRLGLTVGEERVDVLPLVLELLRRRESLDSLRLRGPMMAVPIGGGRYVPVPVERVRALLRVLGEMYDAEGFSDAPRVPALVPYWVDALDDALASGPTETTSSSRRRKPRPEGMFPTREALEPVPAPERLQADLRPYQREGLAFLQALARHEAGGILADDMGLGKTLQTIAHLCVEQAEGRLDRPALVVAPTSLVGNWRREIARFAPHLRVAIVHGRGRDRLSDIGRAHVVVTTYGLVRRDIEAFRRRHFRIVVLDEAQAIKNARSRSHRAVAELQSDLRLCLTGTPIENDLEELRALFDFLMPGFLGDAEQFRTRYRTPIEKLGDEERLRTLRGRVAPFVLRRLKEDVAKELPAKSTIVRPIELEGPQRDLYESIRVSAHKKIREVVREKGLAASTVDVLAALTKLRQVCCDPRLLPFDGGDAVQGSSKLDVLLRMLDELVPQGRRALVFSQFTSMLALIAAELRHRKMAYLTLTGETTNRMEVIDTFERGGANVFLISLKAGGTGLNLVAADTVIHYDPWWNPAAKRQATDRAHRIGQQKPVIVYELIAAGSVEERMLRMQSRKQALADSVLSGAGAGAQAWTMADIDGLFAPLDDGE